ncbi:MAG: amylo-alpha-1,6-glucosidase [Candidatus Micrarchaeota archaeon]
MPFFVRERHLSENAYFLSGLKGFFHRYCGNGFQTKWSGLWFEEKKHLEYFAARLGNEWLSESNSKRFEYNGGIAKHTYQTSFGTVLETLCFHPTRNELMVLLELPKPLSLGFELGIDIRMANENNSSRVHSWIQNKNSIAVQNELGKTFFRVFSGKLQGLEKPFLKTHWPGNEQEICSVNRFFIQGKTIGFTVSNIEKTAVQSLKAAQQLVRANSGRFEAMASGLIESDNPKLAFSLAWGRIGIELLAKKRGNQTVFLAGFPWFLQPWGRDTFWSILGLVDLGLVEESMEQLELFARFGKNGKIPNLLPETFNSMDSTLLWLIAFDYVAQVSGNKAWIKKMLPFAEQSLGFLRSQLHASGLLVHDRAGNETWMDTLNRPQAAVEIQALFIHALESLQKHWKFFSDAPFPMQKELSKAKNAFQYFFADFPFPPDRIADVGQKKADFLETANACLPVAFDLFGKAKSQSVLERLESPDFSSQSGLRCRARNQSGYDPDGYHSGRVWSLSTAWLAMAAFQQRQTENGYRFLQSLQSDLERNALGCVSETFNPETGECNGGLLQLWGQALLCHLIDSHLLGIKIDSLCKKIVFRPQFPLEINSVSRFKKINGKKTVFSAKRNPATNRIDCSVKPIPAGFKIET